MLSEDSEADASPKLIINNHDTEASHSATVGQVDEEDLFYMTSRGVHPELARNMLVEGFFVPSSKRSPSTNSARTSTTSSSSGWSSNAARSALSRSLFLSTSRRWPLSSSRRYRSKLPGLEPGPIWLVARAVRSIVVLAVVYWKLLRIGHHVWRRIAARVRDDERDRE